MGKKEKLLEKAKRNPQALRFSEFETLMEQWGWVFRRQIEHGSKITFS